MDVVDGLLERADVCLDEFSGAVRRMKPGAGQQVRAMGLCGNWREFCFDLKDGKQWIKDKHC